MITETRYGVPYCVLHNGGWERCLVPECFEPRADPIMALEWNDAYAVLLPEGLCNDLLNPYEGDQH